MSDDRWPASVEGSAVVTVIPVEDDAIVLLDPEDRPVGVEQWHPFHNVLRLRRDGSVVWRADLVPGETAWKCWLTMAEEGDEIVLRTASYEATVDPATGKLGRVEFTK